MILLNTSFAYKASERLWEVQMGDNCIGSDRLWRALTRFWFSSSCQQLACGEVSIRSEDPTICLVALDLRIGCKWTVMEWEGREAGAGREIRVCRFLLRTDSMWHSSVDHELKGMLAGYPSNF